ncbi:MAG: hypothetical protein ACI8V2_002816 [Candidatus Latescibacterota bacterium]
MVCDLLSKKRKVIYRWSLKIGWGIRFGNGVVGGSAADLWWYIYCDLTFDPISPKVLMIKELEVVRNDELRAARRKLEIDDDEWAF